MINHGGTEEDLPAVISHIEKLLPEERKVIEDAYNEGSCDMAMKDNKEYVDEHKLLIDDFKNYVKIFIDVDKYNEKSKKGSIEFIGFKFKEILLVSEPMKIELNVPNIIEKKKKVIKNKLKTSDNYNNNVI